MTTETILVVTTGGTIDKQYFDALSEYQITDTTIPSLLRRGQVACPVRVVELLRKDSLDLTDEDRALIRATIAQAPETRVIVTHGSDTMTETARTLSDLAGRTVVLVGAMMPARFSESDAPFNLGMAVATAQVAGEGIWITMSGTVFNALAVRKDRAAGRFVPL